MLEVVKRTTFDQVDTWHIKQHQTCRNSCQTVIIKTKRRLGFLVAYIDFAQLRTICQSFQSRDLVAFKIQLLQLCAIIEAVHLLDQIVKQVDLKDVIAALKRRLTNKRQIVLLQKDVREFRTV